MKKFYLLLVFFLLAGTFSAWSQYSRFIIQLTDKKGTPYTFSNPSAYLSVQAIARRTRYGVTIDSSDLPVVRAYLDSKTANKSA